MAERNHRLNSNVYRGQITAAFTACLYDRTRLLASKPIVEALVPLLAKAAVQTGCTVPIYCFMPDHLHVVMRGTTIASNTKMALTKFKSDSGWWFYRQGNGFKWQKDYWDHIIWPDQDWCE